MNPQAVIEKAAELERLFIKYKDESADVLAAYRQCKPLIDRALAGKFTVPTYEQLPGGYFSTEFDIFNNYRDLYRAASDLDMYLRGWNSEEDFNNHMNKLLGE